MAGTRFQWKAYIDFDRDGSFDTAGDDISEYAMGAQWRIGFQDAFQSTADESQLTLTVRNDDMRFSPEGTASPYYPNLLPQRPIKIDCVYNGGTKTLYTGWIDTFQPAWNEHGEQVCQIHAIGAKQFLSRAELYLDLLQNVTADEVLQAIFEQIIFPPALTAAWLLGVEGNSELGQTTFLYESSAAYDFETGAVEFAYVGDTWANGFNAYDAIARLMRSERGRFYFDRGGTAVFLNRQNFQAHYANDGTVNAMMGGMVYDFGDELYNVVRVSCSPRSITAGTVALWTLDKPVRVEPGESQTIRARYSDSSGAQVGGYNVGTPGITATSGITLTSFSAQARSAEAVFTNAGASAGSVTAMIINGQKLTAFNKVEVEEEDGALSSIYGRRVQPIDCDLLDDPQDARYVAQYELARLKTPRGAVHTMTMQERNANNSAMMFDLTIADRINVIENQTQHDQDYFIVGESWTVNQGMDYAEVQWTVEPASATNFAILDQEGHNQLDVNAYLGF